MKQIYQSAILSVLFSGCLADPVITCIKFKPETTLDLVLEYAEAENLSLIWTKQHFEDEIASLAYDQKFMSENAYVEYGEGSTPEEIKRRWREIHENYVSRLQKKRQSLAERDSVITYRFLSSCTGSGSVKDIAVYLGAEMKADMSELCRYKLENLGQITYFREETEKLLDVVHDSMSFLPSIQIDFALLSKGFYKKIKKEEFIVSIQKRGSNPEEITGCEMERFMNGIRN